MKTCPIRELTVGDIVVTIWGAELTVPKRVTRLDISPTYGGGFVFADGGACWPVRANDNRPVLVMS